MAKVLAGTYRFVRENKDAPDGLERVILKPGDSTKGLPKDVKDQLSEDGLIVEDVQLDKNGLRRGPDSLIRALNQTTSQSTESESESKDDSKDDKKGDK